MVVKDRTARVVGLRSCYAWGGLSVSFKCQGEGKVFFVALVALHRAIQRSGVISQSRS